MSIKSILSAPVRFLNVPEVKQGVKNCIGVLTLSAGCIATHNLLQVWQGKQTMSTDNRDGSINYQHSYKASIFSAKMCLVLSALTSVPGLKIISTLMAPVSETTLNKLFGPNTIFAINPSHPRHVVSIIGSLFGIASMGLAILGRVGTNLVQNTRAGAGEYKWYEVTDKKALVTCGLVLLTSRPVLHTVNQFLSARV